MEIEVLLAAMHQVDHSILNSMNIKTDAIVGNQCDCNLYEKFEYNGKQILFLSFKERGVGLNRNNTLIRSTADICLFADDDIVYCDDYENIVKKSFEKYPKADVLIFNYLNEDKLKVRATRKIKLYNFMKYATPRIAIKREKISLAGISFNQNFGGGTLYSCGEDTIFLHDCLKANLKILHIPVAIASIKKDSTSTWFNGYNEKYFYDRGVLHSKLFQKTLKQKWLIHLFNLVFILRHEFILSEKMTFSTAYNEMNKGSDFYCTKFK